MELTSNDTFFTWAKQHGIGLNPKYPELLAFVPEKGDSRFWMAPFDAREMLVLVLLLLDAFDPWQSCWAYKRLGIPSGYQGSIRFDEEDRAKLVTVLMVQNLFGSNIEHDYYFVPDHGQQFLWLDHEDALWVFFADTSKIEPFVQRMAAFDFELPKEPPPPFSWQHWMGPRPADWKRYWDSGEVDAGEQD
jgi:hypothetical protein